MSTIQPLERSIPMIPSGLVDKLRGWATAAQSNFAFAIASLPPHRREGVVALYGFARVADDFADDEALPLADRVRAIDGLRADVEAIFAGGRPRHPASIRLGEAVRRFGVPRTPLDELLDGVADDLTIARYPTFAALSSYCHKVASAVGLACLPIFGCRHVDTADYAEALGQCLQLTNIVRDVGEDARRGRIYLPADELERYGVAAGSILAGCPEPGFVELMRFQARRARDFGDTAVRIWAQLPAHDRHALGAAEVMRATYGRLLDAVERGGFDVLAPRPRTELGLLHKAAIAALTLVRSRF